MLWLHVAAAMFAAFRLTTLFVSDAIWNLPRKKFPQIPWSCSLCMSVWAGILCTVALVYLPWLNWPLAFSWTYLAYREVVRQTVPELSDKEFRIRQQAIIDFMATQRTSHANDSAQMAGEIAVLRAAISEREEEIAELKKAVCPVNG